MAIKVTKIWLSLIVVLSAITTLGLGDFGGPLVKGFSKESCPLAEEIVKHTVEVAILKDPCMAASLLCLQFHDCFVLVRNRPSQLLQDLENGSGGEHSPCIKLDSQGKCCGEHECRDKYWRAPKNNDVPYYRVEEFGEPIKLHVSKFLGSSC